MYRTLDTTVQNVQFKAHCFLQQYLYCYYYEVVSQKASQALRPSIVRSSPEL
jgi:hypothetical protein